MNSCPASNRPVRQFRQQEGTHKARMSITQPEESTPGDRDERQRGAWRWRIRAAGDAWLAKLCYYCLALRWWTRRWPQERASLRAEILDGLGLLRARVALVQMAASDAAAHAAALRVLVGDETEALVLEKWHVGELRQRASEIGETIIALEAAADGLALPPMHELRSLLARARVCASQLSVVESAINTRVALLSQSHSSLARAGRKRASSSKA